MQEKSDYLRKTYSDILKNGGAKFGRYMVFDKANNEEIIRRLRGSCDETVDVLMSLGYCRITVTWRRRKNETCIETLEYVVEVGDKKVEEHDVLEPVLHGLGI